MGREQSRIGIIIRLFMSGRILFPVISPTWSADHHEIVLESANLVPILAPLRQKSACVYGPLV